MSIFHFSVQRRMTNVKSPVVIVPQFLEFSLAVVQRANLTSANEKYSGNERHGYMHPKQQHFQVWALWRKNK